MSRKGLHSSGDVKGHDMSVFDYNRSRTTVDRLFHKFGQSGTLLRPSNSGSSWDPDVTNDTYPCQLVVLSYYAKDIDGTLIKSGDKRVYVSPIGLKIEPETTDKLIIHGKENTIVSVQELRPANPVVYYECQCRL